MSSIEKSMNRYYVPRNSNDRRKNVCGRRVYYSRFDGVLSRDRGNGVVDITVSSDPRKNQRRIKERRK